MESAALETVLLPVAFKADPREVVVLVAFATTFGITRAQAAIFLGMYVYVGNLARVIDQELYID